MAIDLNNRYIKVKIIFFDGLIKFDLRKFDLVSTLIQFLFLVLGFAKFSEVSFLHPVTSAFAKFVEFYRRLFLPPFHRLSASLFLW